MHPQELQFLILDSTFYQGVMYLKMHVCSSNHWKDAILHAYNSTMTAHKPVHVFVFTHCNIYAKERTGKARACNLSIRAASRACCQLIATAHRQSMLFCCTDCKQHQAGSSSALQSKSSGYTEGCHSVCVPVPIMCQHHYTRQAATPPAMPSTAWPLLLYLACFSLT